MELGALVCTAARPDCADCPVAGQCAWRQAGQPAAPARRAQPGYEGSDRQCRGRLLAVLRAADGPVPAAALDAAWHDPGQRARALAALIADGLVVALGRRCPRPARRRRSWPARCQRAELVLRHVRPGSEPVPGCPQLPLFGYLGPRTG